MFKDKVAIFDEAVDKIAFYSPLLHILYVYIGINGVRIDDVLSFILFFSHQCNTTEIIIQSMIKILSKATKQNLKNSLNTELVQESLKFKNRPKLVDVGCGGKFNQFQCSNNSSFTEDKVKHVLKHMNMCIGESIKSFISVKYLNLIHCFECFDELQKNLQKI